MATKAQNGRPVYVLRKARRDESSDAKALRVLSETQGGTESVGKSAKEARIERQFRLTLKWVLLTASLYVCWFLIDYAGTHEIPFISDFFHELQLAYYDLPQVNILWILLPVCLLLMLFAWAICVAGGRADDDLRRYHHREDKQ